MIRQEAQAVVERVTARVGAFKGVTIKDVESLLTQSQFERLRVDKVRFCGPAVGYVYPWNVVDYLSGMLDDRPKNFA